MNLLVMSVKNGIFGKSSSPDSINTINAINLLEEKWKVVKGNEEKQKELGEKILADQNLFNEILKVIFSEINNTPILDKLLSLLNDFYSANKSSLKLFTSQFIPSIIYIYLQTGRKEVQKSVKIETLLRALYEHKGELGTRPTIVFRIANIHCPSIYHEPNEGVLAETEIAKLKSKPVKVYGRGRIPLTYAGMIHNFPLCTEVWWLFNFHLTEMPHNHGIPCYIKILSKLSSQGLLLNQKRNKKVTGKRIPITSRLLIEMSQTAFFCICNGTPSLGEQLLEEMKFRAEYQLWSDAIIVINGLRKYTKASDENFQLPGLPAKVPNHEAENLFLEKNNSNEIGSHIYELI